MNTTDAPSSGASGASQHGDRVLPRKPFVELLPTWFLAGTGTVYATGFLVVLAFLDRFGIREAGTEFWKARYIHIGILCWVFPLIFNGSLLSLVHLILHGKFRRSTMWQRLLPIGLLVLNLEIVCFIMIMCTNRLPGNAGIAGLRPLLWILAVTLVGVPLLLLIERVIEAVVGTVPSRDDQLSPVSQAFSVSSRWVLVVLVACLDVWYFLEIDRAVTGVQPILALTYVGLSVLLGVILATFAVYERRQEQDGRRRAVAVLALTVSVPFGYLVILAFSYGIYQNIPATRGGGDYTLSPKVVLTLRDDAHLSVLDSGFFEPTGQRMTKPLVLIEETDWAFYLADPSDGGGPAEWKTIGGRKPQILILSKDTVARVHSESRNPGAHPEASRHPH